MWEDDYKKIMNSTQLKKESIDTLKQSIRQKKQRKFFNKPSFKLIIAASMIITLTLGLYLPLSNHLNKDDSIGLSNVDNSTLSNADDYKDIYKLLYKDKPSKNLFEAFRDMFAIGGGTKDSSSNDLMANESFSPSEDSSNKDYSDTNIQVEGVMEADIIKTDGDYIYVISNNLVYITKVDKEKMNLLSSVNPKELTSSKLDINLTEMYITKNRLIVIGYEYEDYNDGIKKGGEEIYYDMYMPMNQATTVSIFDTTNKEDIKLVSHLKQDGYYNSSRMVDDQLYLLSNHDTYNNAKEDDPATFIPSTTTNNRESLLALEDIYISDLNYSQSKQFLLVSSISSQTGKFTSTKSILGYSSTIYSTKDTIYSFSYATIDKAKQIYSATKIVKLGLNNGDITLLGDTTVEGDLLNQFSADEYNGFLRIVTTTNTYSSIIYSNDADSSSVSSDSNQYNNLFILDKDLKTVGSITKIAKDERIYSARFMKDIAYMVTFKQVDPLFAIDLKNPSNPVILSELKIPGFSNYMQPFGDGLLFGIGQNADPETGFTDYVKLSMFNITDNKNVTEENIKILNGVYYSEAQYNHKAILLDAKKNIIAFSDYENYFIFSYDKVNGFNLIKKIELSSSSIIDDFYFIDYRRFIRGLFIDDHFYISSDKGITAYNMTNYDELSSITFK